MAEAAQKPEGMSLNCGAVVPAPLFPPVAGVVGTGVGAGVGAGVADGAGEADGLGVGDGAGVEPAGGLLPPLDDFL